MRAAPGPATREALVSQAHLHPLLSAPILPTLLRLSLPNMLAMTATALVAIAETAYVGRLGTTSLGGMALVFPMIMLQQMMSAGAMGGGVSSGISRALGANNTARAEALASHALMIGVAAAGLFTAVFLLLGPTLFQALGGSGAVLGEALAYSNVAFCGALGVWLTNTLASVVRGGGNMKVPSAVLLTVAAIQIAVGGAFGLGLGPLPPLGMAGVALGQVVAYAAGGTYLIWFLTTGRARVRLRLRGVPFRRELFWDILKVGALACISPLQSVLTVLVLTALMARFGLEALAGYGIGARLEFLLVPMTFAVGVACVPMVGMAIGAGDITRARRVAWIGGALSAALIGTFGMVVAVLPDLWGGLFTTDPGVLAVARSYFGWAGPAYAFLGLGLCLYFASQGSGKILGPVLAQSVRLIVIVAGGWWLAQSQSEPWMMFALVASSMVAYGLASALALVVSDWTPSPR